MVHDVFDFPDFPLLRLVKGVVQGFLETVSYTHLDLTGINLLRVLVVGVADSQ